MKSTKTARHAMETVEAAHPSPHPGKPCGFPTAPTVPTASAMTEGQSTNNHPDRQTVTHVPGLDCYPSTRLLNPVRRALARGGQRTPLASRSLSDLDSHALPPSPLRVGTLPQPGSRLAGDRGEGGVDTSIPTYPRSPKAAGWGRRRKGRARRPGFVSQVAARIRAPC